MSSFLAYSFDNSHPRFASDRGWFWSGQLRFGWSISHSGVWIVLVRVLWVLGFSRNGESLRNAKKRANHAAARLVELAEEHQQILLVGHGFINYFIAKELRKRGWSGPSRPGRASGVTASMRV